jgi:2-polyprenyl-6-methoxyphenol hydroxylase-like FAD-dependent oxidoreductase
MPRALVVGGSLGGLFIGCMLLRAGWDVVVIERTAGALTGRGAGLGVHAPLLEGLRRAGARVDSSIGVAVDGRVTLGPDGAVLASIDMPQLCTSWRRLHAVLSDAFPADRLRHGNGLVGIEQDETSVTARLADGSSLTGDLLVGADGVRSTVRRLLLPEVGLRYAGYVAWRGYVEEAAFSPATHAAIFQRFSWQLPEREQILGYPVPGADDDVRPGRRYYNWVWYHPVEEKRELPAMQTDAEGRLHEEGIAPHAIRPAVIAAIRRVAEAILCPPFAEVVRITRVPIFQPIYDLESPRLVFGRVALLGDAAFVARPHVGMGAIKAAQDAMALSQLLGQAPVAEALSRYDAERQPAGAALVAEGRRLGAYLEGKRDAAPRDPVALMHENGGVTAPWAPVLAAAGRR